MTELRDPSKPPGWVELDADGNPPTDEDGMVIRNDGKLLTPAERNPWYVLMTIAGEIKGDEYSAQNQDRIVKNRRYWNGWAGTTLRKEQKAGLAESKHLALAELEPWNPREREHVLEAFRRRLGQIGLPNLDGQIDLSETHFPCHVSLDGFVVPRSISCEGSTFGKGSNFEKVDFGGSIKFESTTFWGRFSIFSSMVGAYGYFGSCLFCSFANFNLAKFRHEVTFAASIFWEPVYFQAVDFRGDTDFRLSTFEDSASFRFSTFCGLADFQNSSFEWDAFFHNTTFKSSTTFQNSRFGLQVPEFYQHELHQDTDFSARPELWPDISKKTRDEARDAKRAYTRLAQVMSELHKPDDEQFFRRQEMRCAAVLADGPHKWMYRAYEAISDFGYSVWRPLAFLALTVVLGFELLAIGGCPMLTDQTMPRCGWNAMGMSFGNTFGFLGFGRLYFGAEVFRALPAWLQVLGAGQTILGVVFLFFLGLGLRNRFRLR